MDSPVKRSSSFDSSPLRYPSPQFLSPNSGNSLTPSPHAAGNQPNVRPDRNNHCYPRGMNRNSGGFNRRSSQVMSPLGTNGPPGWNNSFNHSGYRRSGDGDFSPLNHPGMNQFSPSPSFSSRTAAVTGNRTSFSPRSAHHRPSFGTPKFGPGSFRNRGDGEKVVDISLYYSPYMTRDPWKGLEAKLIPSSLASQE